jgi:ABC-type uncharacterized transport system substrate-binding protein
LCRFGLQPLGCFSARIQCFGARPGGNATGVSYLLSELGAKQLGLLRELVPAASRFGLLVNPNNENAEAITGDLKAAAATIGVEIDVVPATDR